MTVLIGCFTYRKKEYRHALFGSCYYCCFQHRIHNYIASLRLNTSIITFKQEKTALIMIMTRVDKPHEYTYLKVKPS